MKKVLLVLLHILLFPALIGVVLYFSWNNIMTHTSDYGIYMYIGLILTGVCAVVYYIVYAIVTSRKKKSKSHQTKKLCATVAIMMCGLWMVVDIALPDILSDLTSGTVYYEDLADDWQTRYKVNDQLLRDFIEGSIKAGVLPRPENPLQDQEGYATKDGLMTVKDATDYYFGQGIKKEVPELADNEYYKTVDQLFGIQFQSMDAKGYSAFRHPWIDFATSDRLTIPCIIHLLLDDRPINQEKVKKYREDPYATIETLEDGSTTVTEVMLVEFDKTEKKVVLTSGNWSILDMLGEDTQLVDLVSLIDNPGLINLVGGTIKSIFSKLGDVLENENVLGYRIVVKLEGTEVSLGTVDEARGVMGYQNMAWLDSNGLLFAVASVFSLRYIFLIFAAYGVLINLLMGLCRGMGKDESEKRRTLGKPPVRIKATPENAPLTPNNGLNNGLVSGPNYVVRENYYGSQYIK